MKKLLAVVLLGALVSSLAFGFGFGKKKDKAAKSKKMKVGIVLSIGGLGDKSFNDAAYRGLEMAKDELGINFNYVEPASTAEDEQFLRKYAQAKYDLVIATGFLMKDACEKVAKDFPDVKFAIIDEQINLPNVASLKFKEDEGSFMVGAAAAMVNKSGTVGFVGGMDIPLIRKFQKGFEAGAEYVKPGIKTLSVYTTGSNPFNDPVQGKENALSLIKQGADVVYHAAGGTGMGVIEAAKESGVYAIGVDSNQDHIAPGVVLTSMLKKVDIAVFRTVKAVKEGTFKGELTEFGLAEDGVGTTNFEFTKDKLPAGTMEKLAEIKEKLINGEITIK